MVLVAACCFVKELVGRMERTGRAFCLLRRRYQVTRPYFESNVNVHERF